MAQSSAVREASKERALAAAAELEAEADYRVRLAREGQGPGIDLGAASEGLGAQRLRDRAKRLRELAA